MLRCDHLAVDVSDLLYVRSTLNPVTLADHQHGSAHLIGSPLPPDAMLKMGYDNPVVEEPDLHNGRLDNGHMSTPLHSQYHHQLTELILFERLP